MCANSKVGKTTFNHYSSFWKTRLFSAAYGGKHAELVKVLVTYFPTIFSAPAVIPSIRKKAVVVSDLYAGELAVLRYNDGQIIKQY